MQTSFKFPTSSGRGHIGSWTRCREPSCLGEVLNQRSSCFLHSTSEDQQTYVAKQLADRRPVSLNGVAIDKALFEEVIRSLTDGTSNITCHVSFVAAQFMDRIELSGIKFSRGVNLSAAVFHRVMRVQECAFDANVDARFADFRDLGAAWFFSCRFSGDVDLSFSHSKRQVIDLTSCQLEARFRANGFVGALRVEDTVCSGPAELQYSELRALILTNSRFSSDIDLTGSEMDVIQAKALSAEAATRFGPITVAQGCYLQGAHFGARVNLDIGSKDSDGTSQAIDLDLTDARLESGGALNLGAFSILRLDRVKLGGHLRIQGTGVSQTPPGIISLENTDVTQLSLAGLDVSRCVFTGVPGLEDLTLDPTVRFPSVPSWWMTHRRCIADEYAWRTHSGGRQARRWSLPGTMREEELGTDDFPKEQLVLSETEAAQVAWTYRRLRQGLEKRANEPGAADFYYGEMEMRRRDASAPYAERVLIWLYWLVSGYGLRAMRSVLLLSALILLGAMGLNRWTPAVMSVPEALVTAIWAVLPGGAVPNRLPGPAAAVVIGLRVLGPLLIGLALLALRGRVKR